MITPRSLADFCRYILDNGEARYASDPVRLGAIFREYVGIQSTPTLLRTVDMVHSLGVKIEVVDYLKSGGTNMTANGVWHIHYSANDKAPTQKFTIFHELFEIIQKSIGLQDANFIVLKEPELSRSADRFAAATLIPPDFFIDQVGKTGYDLVKLSEDLELSHQCILIALGNHLQEIPLIGVLYDHRPDGATGANIDIKDFVATVVAKTPPARRIKSLCERQSVPVRNGHAQAGSLVCAAITGGHSLLWRSNQIEDSAAILVRPLLSAKRGPYRVILLAIPGEESGRFSSQLERIEPKQVNGEMSCPYGDKCQNASSCTWKSPGVKYEYGI
jgi:hypothetical protein